MKPFYDDGRVKLYQADVLAWALDYKARIDRGEALPFHAICTDPPYGLSEPPPIEDVLRAWLAGDTYEHNKGGFMGKAWDNLPPGPQIWRALLDITYPGGYLFAFSGTRTADLLGIACRLGGWEPFDRIASFGWVQGQGMKKGQDIGKALDKDAGAEREVVGPRVYADGHIQRNSGEARDNYSGNWAHNKGGITIMETAPATPLAQAFDGYGTGIAPKHEPILLFRKPREGRTFAQCATEFGSGGLNIGATRIKTSDDLGGGTYTGALRGQSEQSAWQNDDRSDGGGSGLRRGIGEFKQPAGRWPPNTHFSHVAPTGPCSTCHGDGCDECHGRGVVGGCRRVGSKRVSTAGAFGGPRDSSGGILNKTDKARDNPHLGYADPDGKETVADWICHESCPVRALDEMAGESKSTQSNRGELVDMRGDNYGRAKGKHIIGSASVRGHNDQGGPSRFYPNHDWSYEIAEEIAERLAGETPFRYVPKASRGERDAGLGEFPETAEHLTGLRGIDAVRRCPEHDASIPSGSNHYTCGCKIARTGEVRERQPQRNTGPCVKPLSLARWLGILACPPSQFSPRLCVPFAGTGSEIIGGILAGGWAEIHAIEREQEYCEIAAARIAWWAKWAKLTGKTDPAEIRKLGEAAESKERWQGDERQRSMFDTLDAKRE